MKTPIVNQLRYFRQTAGLSQIQVAEKLGLNTNNRICRWEKGIALPNVENLAELCKLYNTTPNILYCDLFSRQSN